MMKVCFGADHGGYRLKEVLLKYARELGYECIDFGTFSEDSVDYPDFAIKVALAVSRGEADRGVLICGTGIGMCICANKIKGIRASLCHNEYTARMSRLHNDANVLCLGGRVLGEEVAKGILKVWLETEFEGGRHLRRIMKIHKLEEEDGAS